MDADDEPEVSSTGVEVTPVDVPMTTAMVVVTVVRFIVVISAVPPAVSDILVMLAPFLMSGNERIQASLTLSPATTDAMAVSTGASSSSVVEIPQSPDPEDLIEVEIKILTENIARLLNQSIATALNLGRGLSICTLKLLRDQLDLLSSVASLACTEPFKKAIDKAELYLQELQRLRTTDLDGITELEFCCLSAIHRKARESAHIEMERISVKVQNLNDCIVSTEGYHAELQGAIQEKDATIDEAKAAIARLKHVWMQLNAKRKSLNLT